jgi:ABC-type sugar transport system permease subunit
MVGIPLVFDLLLIWGPTLATFIFSFTNWRGIGPITSDSFIGLRNYEALFGQDQFWAAVQHNLLGLGFLMFLATPLGILMAYVLDGEIRGTWFYQTVFYVPVVLSLAVIGIIWSLMYFDHGLINQGLVDLGAIGKQNRIDFYGDSSINIWAAMVAGSWRHVGYVTILYLAGLKSFDPALREAAAMDGANARQTFFHVVFPVMRPINIVVVVITTIEAFRAFDIVYLINGGRNGLEMLSALITNTGLGESSLVGRGAAIAVILLLVSLVPIVTFLTRTLREDGA